jgi:hypothetical protein
MNARFHLDPTGDPHIWNHNVREVEVHEALTEWLETIKGRGTSKITIGRTKAGRYLKVIYSPDEVGDGIFVVTAFDVPPKQIRALLKRIGRRRS